MLPLDRKVEDIVRKSRSIDSSTKNATILPSYTRWGVCMKGRIYSMQKCPVCDGIFYHDENRGGLFCKKHQEIAASSRFVVRFGRSITKRFSDYHEAERFLTGLRFENDKGTFDVRDYRKDNPLGFENLVRINGSNRRSGRRLKEKTIQSYEKLS
jgi:hypothetical protein